MISEGLQLEPLSRHPARLQLAAGALGTGVAFVFACPALGVASLGALADSERYARFSDARGLRWASRMVALLAIGAIAFALFAPAEVPRWSLLVFALIGMLLNAACVMAAFPLRLSQLADVGRGTSASGFAALFAVGLLFVARPAAWICLAGAVLIALAIGWARLTRRQTAR
jgi:hypothetical protein